MRKNSRRTERFGKYDSRHSSHILSPRRRNFSLSILQANSFIFATSGTPGITGQSTFSLPRLDSAISFSTHIDSVSHFPFTFCFVSTLRRRISFFSISYLWKRFHSTPTSIHHANFCTARGKTACITSDSLARHRVAHQINLLALAEQNQPAKLPRRHLRRASLTHHISATTSSVTTR